MIKLFKHRVTGYVQFEYRPLRSGDVVDMHISSTAAGLPASIRGLTIAKTPIIVGGESGTEYTIQYESNDLLGILTELQECCDVSSITAVTTSQLLQEFRSSQAVINLKNTDKNNLTIYRYAEVPKKIDPSGTEQFNLDVEAQALEVFGTPTVGWSFKMLVDVYITSDELVNDKDSSAKFIFVGQLGGGATLRTIHKNLTGGDQINSARVGQAVHISGGNNSTSQTKRIWVETMLTFTKK